jgi:subtilisin family serine protease
VVISVIDTGMDLSHPDLEPNLLDRNGEDWDFADDDGVPEDGAGHGTHVCGICAATFENGGGIVGVAPSCRLMPLRINLDGGMNQNRADAINFVAKKSRDAAGNRKFVMNCSWGASGNYTAILVAVLHARRDGVVSIFAAGNSNRDMNILPQYPAAYPHVIAVGALNSNNEKSESSNYGSQIDISAPGVNILSTVPSGSYDFKSGTSMAAPHVAGVAALVWSANFALTNQDVREILEGSCEMVDGENPHFIGKLGKGRVNAHWALQAAAAAVPSLDALT